ncbi:MAG: T9SS type A sorting domain-containing protein [Fidelibacterota bacterium]|nr:MAG: T9SS type A sorting domain-containing protein [Candidatus Neomarinimicrobiota bacterium]
MQRSYLLPSMLIIIGLCQILSAQPDTLWTKSIGGDFDDMINSVEQIPGGGFILGGFTESNPDTVRNYWLARLNSTGDDTLWTKAFPAGDTEGRMAITTSDGGAVIVGTGDPRIIKTDGDGVLQWQLTSTELDGEFFGIMETSDGGLIACGVSEVGGIRSACVAEITAAGAVTWEKTYGPSHDSYLFSITELSTGEFAAAGAHRTIPDGNSSDAWLFILSATGDSTESHFFGNPDTSNNERFSQIRSTIDGGFILLGDQTLEGQSKTPYLVKTDSGGVEQWSETFTGLGISELFNVIQTSDSGFTLTGYGDLTLSEGFDMLVIHTDAAGTTDWSKQISGPSGAAGLASTEISAGEYLAVGVVIPEADSPMDGWVVRLGTDAPVAVAEQPGIPVELTLHANYPNPFNPTTTIGFDLPQTGAVTLRVYDVLGREVRQLMNRPMGPGHHYVTWNGRTDDGREVPTGIYIARLVTPENARSIKMVLLK